MVGVDADGPNQCVDVMRSTGGPSKLMRRNLSISSLSDGSVQSLIYSHADSNQGALFVL